SPRRRPMLGLHDKSRQALRSKSPSTANLASSRSTPTRLARMPTQRQIFEALAERLEPVLRQHFMEAIAEIRSDVTLAVVVDSLRAGNIQAALDALNIERAAFGRFEMALLQAYNEGGIAQANLMRLRD